MKNVIIIDIGGIIIDIVFLLNGNFVFELYGVKIGKYFILVRVIYLWFVGLGVESIVKIVDDIVKIGLEIKRWYEKGKNEFIIFYDIF